MAGNHSMLPFRNAVGIMLINRRGKIWVGRRVPKWRKDRSDYIWQMPQGGLDVGETPKQTALRELKEEVGTNHVEILGESADWLAYDLPSELLGLALGGKFRGHRYKWFAMCFLGDDDEIDISDKDGYAAEFDDWRWAHIDELANLGFAFRRKVYERVVAEFRHLTTEASERRRCRGIKNVLRGVSGNR